MNNVLLFFSLKYKGNWKKIYRALKCKEKVSHKDLFEIQNQIEKDYKFVTIINSIYPQHLKNVYKPPFVFYSYGNFNLLNYYYQIVGIVNNFTFNAFWYAIGHKIIYELTEKRRIILVGHDLECDKMIIKSIIANHGRLILITKLGLNEFFATNQDLIENLKQCEDFLIISEYYKSNYLETEQNFYYRLIIGLAKTFLFIKNNNDKSLLPLIMMAQKEEGKTIFTFPDYLSNEYFKTDEFAKNIGKIINSSINIFENIK